VALVAIVAGGEPSVALLLGTSMTLLQFAIGALNDVADAPLDAGRRPGKPIPAGIVSPRSARAVVLIAAAGGLALSVAGPPGLVVIALAGLAIGFAYDLRAKGTAVSWLPLAVGIPLVPVYGWYGATGTLPGLFLVVVPVAATAGTALAIANAIVDAERDAAAAVSSIALAVGVSRAAGLVIALQAIVAALAIGTVIYLGSPIGWVAAVALAAALPFLGAVLGAHAVRQPGTALRELAWEIEAVGTGLLAVAWLGALSASTAPLAGV
jgi:4-hydroxybenzoate polyprenyltransferase